MSALRSITSNLVRSPFFTTACFKPISSISSYVKSPYKLYMTSTNSPQQESITKRLNEVFSPKHVEITNESYKHSVPKGSETHFKVMIVSDMFEGKPLIEQHRMVNEALDFQLKNGVHALAIKTLTTKKWEALQQSSDGITEFSTPNCLGGSKHDKKNEL